MYIVEGNIGAGKSTFLQCIDTHMPSISIALEPLNDWQHEQWGQSLLAHFYQDTKRWAYTFETLTLMSRIKEHLNEQMLKAPVRIVERSIYSGNYCFAKNCYEQGFLTQTEWHMYTEWFNFLTQKCEPPKGFIYLRASPEVAYERIKKRDRKAEEGISLAYIKQIHDKHEQFLIAKKDIDPKLKAVPVLVLDCDVEFIENPAQLHSHIRKLEDFFNTTH